MLLIKECEPLCGISFEKGTELVGDGDIYADVRFVRSNFVNLIDISIGVHLVHDEL